MRIKPPLTTDAMLMDTRSWWADRIQRRTAEVEHLADSMSGAIADIRESRAAIETIDSALGLLDRAATPEVAKPEPPQAEAAEASSADAEGIR